MWKLNRRFTAVNNNLLLKGPTTTIRAVNTVNAREIKQINLFDKLQALVTNPNNYN